MPTRTDRTFSALECADLARVSYRQLDYWLRRGVLLPHRPASGSGSRRQFARHEVSVVRLIGQLMAAGAVTEMCADVVEVVQCLPLDQWSGLLVVWPDGAMQVLDAGTPLARPEGPAKAGWVVDLAGCVVQPDEEA